ncbi:MAG: 50S ribosomal protein L10 [Candidatus Bathyarchaeota archaeon]|nr:50S ribosomal protein L10 [Candidatus Bathyarchaeota archaeon]
MPSQIVLQEKAGEVEEIKKWLVAYKSIGVASLQKVRATQLQELKKSLQGQVNLRVMKNTLMKLAIENLDREDLKKLEPYLDGSNILLFTNLNPFKLALMLEKGKVKTTAKSGDIAAMDVVVPQGNTGQPPGPIISQLNGVGLPTRIESGSVWVAKDTLVVRKGEAINERLASVLSKLGIKAVEAGLSMRAAYDEGLMVLEEQLRVDVEATRKSLLESQSDAFALALGLAYPSADTIESLLQVAHQKATALSVSAGIVTKDTIADLIRRANAEMASLNNAVEQAKPKA